jgi:SAM-dependent methyltransferase
MTRRSAEVPFAEYLEAKLEIDSRSLSPGVAEAFRERLARMDSPRLLDVGTGTGAMLRRLARIPMRGEPFLVGLDSEAASLSRGRREVAGALRQDGWSVRPSGGGEAHLRCGRGRRRLDVALLQGDVMEDRLPEVVAAGGFHAVTAHAILDLLPPKAALVRLRALLDPGGLLYTTLNYDGLTVLLPSRDYAGFEARLLRAYDRSMEQRRYRGRRTAGAKSGRRIHDALLRGGWQVLALGSSDWCVAPVDGEHTPGRRVFLRAMLGFMRAEGSRARGIDGRELERWHRERLEDVAQGRLALVVHQLDLLAYPGNPPHASMQRP